MSKRQTAILLGAVLAASMLTGCAGTVVKQIDSDDRDTSGLYDGAWKVDVDKGAALQYVQNWQVNCGDLSQTFYIVVDDGSITLKSSTATVTGYVSTKGRFKMYLPVGGNASSSSRSDSTVDHGKRKVVLRGRLSDENSVGYITHGVAQFGYAGCTAKTRFTRVREGRTDQAT